MNCEGQLYYIISYSPHSPQDAPHAQGASTASLRNASGRAHPHASGRGRFGEGRWNRKSVAGSRQHICLPPQRASTLRLRQSSSPTRILRLVFLPKVPPHTELLLSVQDSPMRTTATMKTSAGVAKFDAPTADPVSLLDEQADEEEEEGEAVEEKTAFNTETTCSAKEMCKAGWLMTQLEVDSAGRRAYACWKCDSMAASWHGITDTFTSALYAAYNEDPPDEGFVKRATVHVQGGGGDGITLSCDSAPADGVKQNPFELGKWGVSDKPYALTGSQNKLSDGSNRVVLGHDQYTGNLCDYGFAGKKKMVVQAFCCPEPTLAQVLVQIEQLRAQRRQ